MAIGYIWELWFVSISGDSLGGPEREMLRLGFLFILGGGGGGMNFQGVVVRVCIGTRSVCDWLYDCMS